MSIQVLTTALNAVMPIVLLIVLGYLLRQKGVLTDQFLSIGNKLVFSVCLPVMMFVNVYGIASISDVRWDICLYSVAAVTLLFLLGIVLALAVTPVPERRGVLLQCSFRSNFAIIGMPLAATLGGEAGAAVAAMLNVLFSVFLGKPLGIAGVLLGTVLSRAAVYFWYDPYIIHKRVLEYSVRHYFKRYAIYGASALAAGLITLSACRFLPIEHQVGHFALSAVICTVVPNGLFWVLFHKTKAYSGLRGYVVMLGAKLFSGLRSRHG